MVDVGSDTETKKIRYRTTDSLLFDELVRLADKLKPNKKDINPIQT